MKKKKGYKFLELGIDRPATEKQKYYIKINNLGDPNISFPNAFAMIKDHKIKLLKEEQSKKNLAKLKIIQSKREEKEKTYDFSVAGKNISNLKNPKASKQLKDYAKSKGLIFDEDIRTRELRDLIDELNHH